MPKSSPILTLIGFSLSLDIDPVTSAFGGGADAPVGSL
jgi:hypothetical protein